MRSGDSGRRSDGQGPDLVGVEAVSVVRARIRTATLVPIQFAALGEAFEDLAEGLAETMARTDDLYWAFHVTRPFTWQRFIDWWAVRRWVYPRDPPRW